MNLHYTTLSVPGDNRETLAKGVLAGLMDGDKLRKKLSAHPADDEALEWMRQERRRAEDRAEKRWRGKFQEWASSHNEAQDSSVSNLRELARAALHGHKTGHTASAPSLRRGDRLAPTRTQADELREISELTRTLTDALGEERIMKEELQRRLDLLEEDRDISRQRAEQLEAQLLEAKAQHKGAGLQAAELGRLIDEIRAHGDSSLDHAGPNGVEESRATDDEAYESDEDHERENGDDTTYDEVPDVQEGEDAATYETAALTEATMASIPPADPLAAAAVATAIVLAAGTDDLGTYEVDASESNVSPPTSAGAVPGAVD